MAEEFEEDEEEAEVTRFRLTEIIIMFGTLITPILLIWSFMDYSEPTTIKETVALFFMLVITGCGGLGIGAILAHKLSRILGEE